MADDLLGIGEATTAISKGAMGLLQALLGPAMEEAGQIFADRVRYWRWKNALSMLEQVNQTLLAKGITPQQIPLKTLMPIMEGIAVEEESENLKAKWVNLISNAAAGQSIHPKYIKLFSDLDSIDAIVLDTVFCLHESKEDDMIRQYFDSSKVMTEEREDKPLFDYPDSYEGNLAVVFMAEYLKDIQEKKLDYEIVAESIRYLEQLNLLEKGVEESYMSGRHYRRPTLTTFGLGFLRLVSEPKKAI
ncbi:Abi-alpha family protein [Leptothoe sp. PORK10 BA2]|uniref:Abi-alpha family protein n=1 Tax=Leptothoe sp. PORK10 BA2 TaxID=3110254 RepID=UPI002B21ACE8|nr:hypothetical protein [Leptothoe sp. PORK10 BA2]MEA5467214.1 hypothetical protein [Leptothoe sp. PORK10 BA2]